MKMEEISTDWGVVYNDDKLIFAIKTPNNAVYPSAKLNVYKCATKVELDRFITENELSQIK